VTDQPMIPEGVKTSASDKVITTNYVDKQIRIGIEALHEIKDNGRSVRHLKWM
jgi:AMP nucleosidase